MKWPTRAAVAIVIAVLVATTPTAAATNTAVASIHTTDTDFSAGTLTNTTVQGSGNAAFVRLQGNKSVDSFEDENLNEYTGDTASFDITSGDATDGTFKLESTASSNPMVSTSGLDQYYDRGDGNLTVDVKLNGGDGIVIFGASGTDNHFDISIDGSDDEVRIRKRSGGGGSTDLTSTTATLPDTDYIRLLVDWDTNGDIFVRLTNRDTGSEITTLSTTDTADFGDGIGFNTRDANIQFDNARAGASPAVGEYISTSHDAEKVTEGFTNLTLENATAYVTWQSSSDGGSSWSDVATNTYTTSGNKTLGLSGADPDWRVNVTFERGAGETTAELHDEGVRFTNHSPTVNNSSLSPNDTDVNTSPVTLSVDINDSDFPTEQGDTVTVEFYDKEPGSSTFDKIGEDTLTSNGTASISESFVVGGEHEWYVWANDSYGGTQQSNMANFTVPGSLEVRTERDPHTKITGMTVKATFFEDSTEDPVIVRREVTDGTIDLAGLPTGTEFAVSVNATGYFNRTVLIDSIFEQDTVFLLNRSANAVSPTFTVEDRTGNFPGDSTEIVIERAINDSLYSSSTDGYEWRTVAGDDVGADRAYVADLQQEQRYRIKVQNEEGDTRILGAYTAENSDLVELQIGEVLLDPDPTDGPTYNTTYVRPTTSTAGSITFQLNDSTGNTTDIYLHIYEYQNESNELLSNTSFNGPFGTFSATESVPPSERNTTYVVEYTLVRPSGNIRATNLVGPKRPVLTGIPVWLKTLLFGGVIFMLTALFSQGNAAIGSVVVAGVGAILFFVDFVPPQLGAGVVLLALMASGMIWINQQRSADL